VAVDVEDRRQAAVGLHEDARVDVDLALLEVPVGPHLAILAGDLETPRQPQHLPELCDPRPDRDDHLLDCHGPLAGVHARDRAVVVELEARDLDPLGDLGAGLKRLPREPVDRLFVEREPAAVLVQTDGQPGRAPVGEHRPHVARDLGLAQDQLRLVADPLLALGDRGEVRLLVAVAEGDVTGAVVVERLRVRLPDLDACFHQLGHGGLEVVVADDAAGDAGSTRGDRRLVDHQHLLAALGEVPGGGEAVNAGPDHEVGNRALAHHQ
jgi:hypothetical protein